MFSENMSEMSPKYPQWKYMSSTDTKKQEKIPFKAVEENTYIVISILEKQ